MAEVIMWAGVLVGLGGLGVLCWFRTRGREPHAHRGRRVGRLVAYLLGVAVIAVTSAAGCFHHEQARRRAAGIAVCLVRRAHAVGVAARAISDYDMDHASAEGLDLRDVVAVSLLVRPSAGITLNDDPDLGPSVQYDDGRHRVAAHIDQGVPETVVQRVKLIGASE